ncbi:MAG: hypothetical protein Q8R18_06630 [bacterium]|nr:hypothetical protein [bacterium]
MDKVEHYEIRMQLDSYEDIFSDFDPRPFHERALSDDFLAEAKKASIDKTEEIDIFFFLPKTKRDAKSEATIKKRILAHSKRHFTILQKDQKKIVKMGGIFTVIGVVLMVIATFSLYKYERNLVASLIIIILEPASWFLFWEGLNLVIFSSKKKQPELIFYEKMSRAHIFFANKET